jgi:NAD(P)-dependent dehydrogenase (short-subunit alcohol dehydrogenase family)
VNLRTVVDDLLEITVVGSFSSIGPAIRRRLHRWQPPAAGSLRGATVLVTGPTSGLGRAAAGAFAALGARVILVGRNRDRLSAVRSDLTAIHGEDRFPIVVADLSSLAETRAAATRILASESRLDVLLDNAGAIHADRTESPDGIEATFATMVVGPFALISGLLPLLRATPGARVITMASGGMYAQRLHLDDLEWTGDERWNGTKAYARAKRGAVALIREWARRVPVDEVRFVAMHPGWADTPGVSAALPGFARVMAPILRTPAEGIDTAVWLATQPAAVLDSGRLYHDRRTRPFDRVPATRVNPMERRHLWDAVVRLAAIPDPAPDGQIPFPIVRTSTRRRTA